MTKWVLKLSVLAMISPAGIAHAADPAFKSPPAAVDAQGVVTVPSHTLPPSIYLSKEAVDELKKGPNPLTTSGPPPLAAIPAIRAGMKKGMAPLVEALTAQYEVSITETTLDGIHGYWVRPLDAKKGQPGKAKRKTVLLNLPAGGFLIGQANPIGLIEAIPIAGLGGFDILTIDYRQAPEAVFPAASEDTAKAYRSLLKTYAPQNVGIFGCSAGGLLTAQSLAWFQKEKLPVPGAAGILCASADGRWAGDSWYWQKPIQGIAASPSLDEEAYYGKQSTSDPLLSPMESDAVLKLFPPTLLISATRAGELSSAVDTHRRLIRNGVDADLHVWDGLGHAFYSMTPHLPESKEAFAVIVNFFEKNLGQKKPTTARK